LGLALFIGAFAAVGFALREELVASSAWFVETLGATGIVLGFLLPDLLSLPLPQDAVTAFGLAGGMGFWEVVFLAAAGSLLGGSLAFAGGRHLRRTRLYERLVTRRCGVDAEGLIRRYGVTAVAIAALTPLPYSVMCWAAGALGMPYRTFILISLLRFPRVAFWLYLIELGLIAATG